MSYAGQRMLGIAEGELLGSIKENQLRREYEELVDSLAAERDALQRRVNELQAQLNDKSSQLYAESALIAAMMEEARIIKVSPSERLLFTSFHNKAPREEMRGAFRRMGERGVSWDEARNRGISHVREAHGLDGRTGKPTSASSQAAAPNVQAPK